MYHLNGKHNNKDESAVIPYPNKDIKKYILCFHSSSHYDSNTAGEM